MKTTLFFCTCMLFLSLGLKAQVTQINNNNSLEVIIPLDNDKTILSSHIDSSIWVTDATLPGTVQISTIKFESDISLLSGKVIFRGSTAATGSELYITDGTPAGTTLVSDIVSGTTGSEPANMTLMGGFVYFTANTPAEGRELWRTNGTPGGTTLVKDIISGTDGTFATDGNELFTNGTYLLFAGSTPSSGIELYKSDGTSGGTDVLKDINPLSSDSSNPKFFYQYNGMVLFLATDADHGEEIWKTDGTTGGTEMVKDINDGTPSSTTFEIFPGFPAPIFLGFHLFNNKVYFNASDGTSNGQIWSTDGIEANTVLLKDVVPTTSLAFILLLDAVNLPGKFIFPVADGVGSSELWESDGTTAGTKVFMAFSPVSPDPPFILLSFNFTGGTLTQPLFQGNKFFFVAGTATEGKELWISDGTLANTTMVKDISPGFGDGIISNISYVFTATTLFFAADDGTNGNEVWKTDGTSGGTSMVFDINPNSGDADPNLYPIVLPNGKVIFGATDGDDPDQTDLYVIDGTFSPLPITLTDFTVSLNAGDALLHWSTLQETNTKDFTVQRSYDGRNFVNIGIVQAGGTVSSKRNYSFKDAGIINSGKDVAYYRLVASDKDGKIKNTNVISLRLKGPGKWNVVVLSNPVQDNLRILLSGINAKVQLSIRDVSGRIIYTNSLQNVNGQISLPAKLQRGVHILTVETNNEKKVIQFVKQ